MNYEGSKHIFTIRRSLALRTFEIFEGFVPALIHTLNYYIIYSTYTIYSNLSYYTIYSNLSYYTIYSNLSYYTIYSAIACICNVYNGVIMVTHRPITA